MVGALQIQLDGMGWGGGFLRGWHCCCPPSGKGAPIKKSVGHEPHGFRPLSFPANGLQPGLGLRWVYLGLYWGADQCPEVCVGGQTRDECAPPRPWPRAAVCGEGDRAWTHRLGPVHRPVQSPSR